MQTPYHYQAINVDEIRLLRLRPGDSKILEGELVTCRYDDEVLDGDAASAFIVRGRDVRVVDEGDYDAISYYWGAGEPTTHITIYHSEVQEEVVGHIPLKPSLEMALKTFRALLDPQKIKFFWIDAICIDQQNKAEKSAQIRRMAVIYNQADIVRVWLGEDSSKSDIAMDFVGDLVNLNNIDELSSQMNHKWAAFRDLLRREWFNRRWILQEIALARRALVYCGKKSVEWETFAYAVSLFTAKSAQLKRLFMASPDHNFDPDYLGELNALGAKILIDVTNNMFRKHDNGDIEEHLVSLEGLMSLLSMFEASNPHDTIYAILWLAYDATPGAARPAAIYPGVARSPMASPRVTSRAHHRPDDSIDIRIDLVPSLKITDAGSMTSSPTDMHFNALEPEPRTMGLADPGLHVNLPRLINRSICSHRAHIVDVIVPAPFLQRDQTLERRRHPSPLKLTMTRPSSRCVRIFLSLSSLGLDPWTLSVGHGPHLLLTSRNRTSQHGCRTIRVELSS